MLANYWSEFAVLKNRNVLRGELKGIYGRRVSLVAWKWLNSEENTQHNC